MTTEPTHQYGRFEPLEPLAWEERCKAALYTLATIEEHVRASHGGDLTDDAMAGRLGTSRRSLIRWRDEQGGLLTEKQADAAACAAGVHPSSIWSDWDDHEEDWAE